ncbi:M4 family metallopeptidase [Bacillus massilinigeriensis]|uniref:M4 family metallopeptidase n=1 Tax=Bacillus massilionigeriensis TaxID=1805475 RepID=UPI00096B44D5|nr:M4 family metallopeptidase [Bacillus massilionigeriensis]
MVNYRNVLNLLLITFLSLAIILIQFAAFKPIFAKANSNKETEVIKNEKGQAEGIFGNLGKVQSRQSLDKAFEGLEKVKDFYGIEQIEGGFCLTEVNIDQFGTMHIKLDRMLNGIKVMDQQMILHFRSNEFLGVNGFYTKLTANLLPNQASISKRQAIINALESTGFYGSPTKEPTGELVYFVDGNRAILAYVVRFSYSNSYQPGNWTFVVNAKDGTILDSFNNIESVMGSGKGVLGGIKQINTTLKKDGYYLIDELRRIETYSFNNKTSFLSYIKDPDNLFFSEKQKIAVDAHYHTSLVYDYLLTNLNWKSWNNKDSLMISSVDYSQKYNNAFWDGERVVFGNGDGVNFLPFSASLDIVAHEWAHGIVQSTSNLRYKGQSGALAESFADTLAVAIEDKNWLIGEDIYTPSIPDDALSSLQNPEFYGQPNHMSNYVNTTMDNAGVHTNSGIPNKAFYLFASKIGSKNVAEKIWFIANRYYFTTTTDFTGARLGTLQACADLYGKTSDKYRDLQKAWDSVGIK